MIAISKKYWFDSAHQLKRDDWTPEKNFKVFGKCSSLHGHTYVLKVQVTGEVDPETGMILNYFDLDAIVKPLVDELLDHRNLNNVMDGLTTAENMVVSIAQLIKNRLPTGITLMTLTLQETPKTSAVWVMGNASE